MIRYRHVAISTGSRLLRRRPPRFLSSLPQEEYAWDNDAAQPQSTQIRAWTRRDMLDPKGLHLFGLHDFVTDIALRLQQQMGVCDALSDIVQDRKQKQKKVIATSAYLTPYWWQPSLHDAAKKSIRDLQILHRDTHQLCLDVDRQLVKYTHNNAHVATLPYPLRRLVDNTMKQIVARHANTIETVAELIIGLRAHPRHDALAGTVQRFLKNRLIVQMLGDHVAIHLTKNKSAVSLQTSLVEVAEDAVTEASHLCEAHLLASPSVYIHYSDTAHEPHADMVRPWLHYVLVELLKNSMAITVERGRGAIHIVIEPSPTGDWMIYIHDQGGGFAKATTPQELFTFAQCSKKWDRLDDQTTYAMTRSPLRGLGVGLSLSKIMMQCFGGDVDLAQRGDGQGRMLDVAGMVNSHDGHVTRSDSAGPFLELQEGCTATVRLNQDLDSPMQS